MMMYKGFEVTGAGTGLYVGTFRGVPLVGGSGTLDVMQGIDALEDMGVLTVVEGAVTVASDFFGLPACDDVCEDMADEEDDVCEECGVDAADLDEADDIRQANAVLTRTVQVLNTENARLHRLALGQEQAVQDAAQLSRQATERIQALQAEVDALRASAGEKKVSAAELSALFLHNPVALSELQSAVNYAQQFRKTPSLAMACVYQERVRELLKSVVGS